MSRHYSRSLRVEKPAAEPFWRILALRAAAGPNAKRLGIRRAWCQRYRCGSGEPRSRQIYSLLPKLERGQVELRSTAAACELADQIDVFRRGHDQVIRQRH